MTAPETPPLPTPPTGVTGAADSPPVSPASVVTPQVIGLRSGAIAVGGVLQVHHRAAASGRLVGVRHTPGARVARIIAEAGTMTRKVTDPKSWNEILRDQPLLFRTGQYVILVVANETTELKAFEVEIEVEIDPTLTTPTAAKGGSPGRPGALSMGGAAQRAAAGTPGSAIAPGARRGASSPAVPSPRRGSSSKAFIRNPAAKAGTRADGDILYVVLDRMLCDRIEQLLTRKAPAGSAELGRIGLAFDQGRVRREPPNTRGTDVLVSIPFYLLARLDAALRRGVRLSAEDTAEVIRLLHVPSSSPIQSAPSTVEDASSAPTLSPEAACLLGVEAGAALACAAAIDAYVRVTEPPVGADPSFWNGVAHTADWLREQAAIAPLASEGGDGDEDAAVGP